jgi:hypothetical protein
MTKSIIKHTRFKSSSLCAQTVFNLITRCKTRAGLDQICLLYAASARDLTKKAISTKAIEPPHSSDLPQKFFQVLLRHSNMWPDFSLSSRRACLSFLNSSSYRSLAGPSPVLIIDWSWVQVLLGPTRLRSPTSLPSHARQYQTRQVLQDISLPVDNLSLLATPRVTYGGIKRL